MFRLLNELLLDAMPKVAKEQYVKLILKYCKLWLIRVDTVPSRTKVVGGKSTVKFAIKFSPFAEIPEVQKQLVPQLLEGLGIRCDHCKKGVAAIISEEHRCVAK